MNNIFSNPNKYILEIANNVRIEENKQKKFLGKTMAFLFLTKFCDVECAHCFFKSKKNVNSEHSIEYELTEEGIEKTIEFINKSNNGYLSVLGGGEPFNRFDYIIKIIQKVKTDRLVLVTSGNWATTPEITHRMICQLKSALENRNDNLKIVLRISVDKWHVQKIGSRTLINIINEIRNDKTENFDIELHTLTGDDCIKEILTSEFGDYEVIGYKEHISDNTEIQKLGYARYKAILQDGFVIKIGIAQKFNSNLKVDLNNQNDYINQLIKYFDDDINYNCFGNPSLVYDKDKESGLDFLISYNGNITTWGNDQTYDLSNIYIHNYEKIISRSLNNIISYSFIDKGEVYRESIFNEINPKAVIRAKAINIRDYACCSLFEERASVLYYGIRVIKDYINENILLDKNLENLSDELKENIKLSKEEIIELYKMANYTILDQYREDEKYSEIQWRDLFELIRLGHYDITEEKIREGLETYNYRFGKNASTLEEFKENSEEQYARLLNRLAQIDEKVKLKVS